MGHENKIELESHSTNRRNIEHAKTPQWQSACIKKCVCLLFWLTQFIKVRFGAVFLQNWTHHPGFEEGGPLVHQTPLSSNVTLQTKVAHRNSKPQNILYWLIRKKEGHWLDTLWPPWCGYFLCFHCYLLTSHGRKNTIWHHWDLFHLVSGGHQ